MGRIVGVGVAVMVGVSVFVAVAVGVSVLGIAGSQSLWPTHMAVPDKQLTCWMSATVVPVSLASEKSVLPAFTT